MYALREIGSRNIAQHVGQSPAVTEQSGEVANASGQMMASLEGYA